jgi:PmbA protein
MTEEMLHDLTAAALAAGAEAAEAAFAERQALSVSVRLGALEEVEREESRDLGIRVLIGKRQASVSGSDISRDGRRKLVERAVAMARLAPEDPWVGLAPSERLARGPRPDFDLYDPTEPGPEALEASAGAAEDAAGRRGHQFQWRLGQLVILGLAPGDQRRLQRRTPRHRLFPVGPGDRRRRLGDGTGL